MSWGSFWRWVTHNIQNSYQYSRNMILGVLVILGFVIWSRYIYMSHMRLHLSSGNGQILYKRHSSLCFLGLWLSWGYICLPFNIYGLKIFFGLSVSTFMFNWTLTFSSAFRVVDNTVCLLERSLSSTPKVSVLRKNGVSLQWMWRLIIFLEKSSFSTSEDFLVHCNCSQVDPADWTCARCGLLGRKPGTFNAGYYLFSNPYSYHSEIISSYFFQKPYFRSCLLHMLQLKIAPRVELSAPLSLTKLRFI